MKKIQFEVYGTPEPKGSYRAVKNKATGQAVLVPSGDDDRKARLKAWTRAVAVAARAACTPIQQYMNTPLTVTIVFKLPRPKDHYSARGGLKPWAMTACPHFKPDIDKLVRSTLDAMTGIVFDDDARIVAIQVHKVYAIDDEGAWVSVRPCTSVRPELPTTPEELARVC